VQGGREGSSSRGEKGVSSFPWRESFVVGWEVGWGKEWNQQNLIKEGGVTGVDNKAARKKKKYTNS